MIEIMAEMQSTGERASGNETGYDLLVVGGGLAGIAAALEARKLNPDWRIALLESRRRLGGRAGSFIDPKSGNWIDNCQHVGLGCCPELIDFVAGLGRPDAFRRSAELLFYHPDGYVDRIYGSRFLPPPLHLAPAFAKVRFLNVRDKLALAYGILKLVMTPYRTLEEISVASWLNQNRQTPNAIHNLWEPVLVSALNDSLDRIHAAGAKKVMLESFFRRRDGFHLLVPAMPLGILFDEDVRRKFERDKIAIYEGNAVQQLHYHEPKKQFEIAMQDGLNFTAGNLILATPWPAAAKLLEALGMTEFHETVEKFKKLEKSPITGIHLVLDKRVCEYQEIALLGRTIQWVFDHTAADVKYQPGLVPEGGQSLQLVVSASHSLLKYNRDEIMGIALS
ncbi:MAG: FAD-dependent oxidoreductase, partial [Planctomycetota bacterium]